MERILTIDSKQEARFLRKRTIGFDFQKFSRREIGELIQKMRKTMIQANGIGLSANQVGLDLKFFIVQLQKHDKHGRPRSLSVSDKKFYAIFNPEIVKSSKEKVAAEEGCLSIPNVYGHIERSTKIIINGFDRNGRKIKIKARGLLARVFQHEMDHLSGKLFTDKAKNIYKVES